jgi:hypothetical protein
MDKMSMIRINNIGERGPPCLSPFWCAINQPGMPFRRIWVEDVASNPLIMSYHICSNPIFFMISSRNVQDTESKAFEMSNLNKMRAAFVGEGSEQSIAQA